MPAVELVSGETWHQALCWHNVWNHHDTHGWGRPAKEETFSDFEHTSTVVNVPCIDKDTKSVWALPVGRRKGRRQPWKRRGRFELTEVMMKLLTWSMNECTCRQTSVDIIGDEGLSGAVMQLLVGMNEIRWRWKESAQVQHLRGASPVSCIHPWVTCDRK